jgi:hypothetical protein
MGNAAAMPISAKECEKYGITIDAVKGFNEVVKDSKKKKKGKKLDSKDLEKIQKFCSTQKGGKGIPKLLENRLMKGGSVTETSVTQASTRYDDIDTSIVEGMPTTIELAEIDDDDMTCLTIAPVSVDV